ncbi:MAG TPA: hypothetical protein VG013_10475 [Gemmataceae bacterium]|jgi:hypothetical protein|nr:hypothetical protein [Gemmataceae bacterium]
MLRLKPLIVRDPAFQQEAFRLLIPADWRGTGRVDWRFHPQYPAALSVRAENPAGAEAVYSYPLIPFVAGVWHLPEGGYYLGNEVRPYPGGITAYVQSYLLPRLRPEMRNYRVLDTRDMPKWAGASTAVRDATAVGIPASATAGCVRIAYTDGGRAVQEEFYVMLVRAHIVGLDYWGTELCSSVRAEPGHLDPVRKIYETMVSSFRLDVHWFSRQQQVAAMVVNVLNNEQAAVMNLSRYLAQTNDQVTAVIRDSYQRRQDAMDRVNAQFSQYIRGVDEYSNPFEGHPVELPSGYRNAWANAAGEYILSDDPNFNPNVQGTGNWQALRPTH